VATSAWEPGIVLGARGRGGTDGPRDVVTLDVGILGRPHTYE
jgi:hypothetical protein